MKRCGGCDTEKPITEFGNNRSKPDGLQSSCKKCRVTYNKAHYEKTKHKHKESRAESRERLRHRNRQKMLEYLEGKVCEQCGFSDIRALEFDHLTPGTKKNGVSALMSFGWSTVLKEIQKCRILCANCHRIHTSEVINSYRHRHVANVGLATGS